jgi:hypothetical protein
MKRRCQIALVQFNSPYLADLANQRIFLVQSAIISIISLRITVAVLQGYK